MKPQVPVKTGTTNGATGPVACATDNFETSHNQLALLFQHFEFNMSRIVRFVKDVVRSGHKIGRFRLEDIINVLLRVAIDQWKPSTLHMNHHFVTRFKRVVNILDR